MRNTAKAVCAAALAWALSCQALAVGTSAASAILIEQQSGRVLYAQNADEERLIASITKIMTAVVALENGSLQDTYTVTAEDMAEGSSMYLRPGETLRLEELLYGLMLSSGNDAALAVAHCVSGSVEGFVDEMNATAARLGMSHSHFENPNGLDAEGHYASAADMAVLAAYALDDQDFLRIVSTTSINIGGRYLANHNKLLKLCDGCIGVKTGFTKAAGRTLVSAARRDGMTLVCVTLNDGDDWNDHMALFDYGFSQYRLSAPAGAGQVMASTLVRNGDVPSVGLMAAERLCYPVAEGETLTMTVRAPMSVAAPVMPGQAIGKACLCLDGREVASVDLVAAEPAAVELGTAEHPFFAY